MQWPRPQTQDIQQHQKNCWLHCGGLWHSWKRQFALKWHLLPNHDGHGHIEIKSVTWSNVVLLLLLLIKTIPQKASLLTFINNDNSIPVPLTQATRENIPPFGGRNTVHKLRAWPKIVAVHCRTLNARSAQEQVDATRQAIKPWQQVPFTSKGCTLPSSLYTYPWAFRFKNSGACPHVENSPSKTHHCFLTSSWFTNGHRHHAKLCKVSAWLCCQVDHIPEKQCSLVTAIQSRHDDAITLLHGCQTRWTAGTNLIADTQHHTLDVKIFVILMEASAPSQLILKLVQ